MFRTAAPLFGALLALCAGAFAQTTVTIPCDRDNTLYEDPTGSLSNGAGAGLFVGKNAGNLIRRALVHFDVAGAVPAGARVVSVRLSFYISPTLTAGQTATLHRVMQDWGEGTSVAAGNGGGGAPATTNDATWLNRFHPGSPWSNAGGDYDPTPSSAMPLVLLLNSQPLSSRATADVQSWLDNPGQNFGWLLRNSETAPMSANRIESRESGGSVLPSLSVSYMLPGTAGSWGIGCLSASGFLYSFQFVGAPIGGTTLSMAQVNGPANALAVHFFAFEIDAAGTPLAPPPCRAWLPLGSIVSGPTVLLDGSGSASTPLLVPAGFPGYLVACQVAALDPASPIGLTVSNAGLICLQ